jgi:proteasome lid subunit RPN8/RPN11
LPVERVVIKREVVESLLSYSQMAYPREGILLLRGKVKKGLAEVSSVMIPPGAVHGQGFSSFSWFMMPIDSSFLGVAHSHPSGYAVPSQEDLLHLSGRIMVIIGHPYSDESSLHVFNSKGRELPLEVE